MSVAANAIPVQHAGVIVTGGSSGLGRATALLMAGMGRAVAIWGTNLERIAAAVKECQAGGGTASGHVVDICSKSEVDEAVGASRCAIGPISGLVCAAGRLRYGPIGRIDFAEWELTLRTNLTGVAHTLEASLPVLREAGRGASVVVMASTEAIRGSSFLASYSASKHGVLGLVSSASRALAPAGIRVNAVCAGAMDTPMMDAALEASGGEAMKRQLIAAIPMGYISDPREVAHVIGFLLAPEASYVTGAAIPVDGGMLA